MTLMAASAPHFSAGTPSCSPAKFCNQRRLTSSIMGTVMISHMRPIRADSPGDGAKVEKYRATPKKNRY
jgi:hypothetical protein